MNDVTLMPIVSFKPSVVAARVIASVNAPVEIAASKEFVALMYTRLGSTPLRVEIATSTDISAENPARILLAFLSGDEAIAILVSKTTSNFLDTVNATPAKDTSSGDNPIDAAAARTITSRVELGNSSFSRPAAVNCTVKRIIGTS